MSRRIGGIGLELASSGAFAAKQRRRALTTLIVLAGIGVVEMEFAAGRSVHEFEPGSQRVKVSLARPHGATIVTLKRGGDYANPVRLTLASKRDANRANRATLSAESGTIERREPDAQPVAALLRGVADFERVFSDVEMLARTARFRPDSNGSAGRMVACWSSRESVIAQENRLFARKDAFDRRDGAGPRYGMETVTFDGAASKEVRYRDSRTKCGFAQETRGRSRSAERIATEVRRPHVMLIQCVTPVSSLANYLRSATRLRRLDGGSTRTVENVPCIGLQFDAADGSLVRLWLAQRENLIPARMEVYDRQASETLPVIVAACAQWTALKDGVVAPLRARVTRFEASSLAEGDPQVQEIEELALEAVRISPSYPKESFSALPIADGTRLRRDLNGTTTETLYGDAGAPQRAAIGREAASTVETMLLVNNVLIAIYVMRLVYSLYARRAADRA